MAITIEGVSMPETCEACEKSYLAFAARCPRVRGSLDSNVYRCPLRQVTSAGSEPPKKALQVKGKAKAKRSQSVAFDKKKVEIIIEVGKFDSKVDQKAFITAFRRLVAELRQDGVRAEYRITVA